jgi:sugar/nucleoside kinase (ribokinase family)
LVDHLILSRRFASQLTDESRPDRILEALWNPHRRTVAVTGGEDGCWTLENGELQHFPAFPVKVVDTTGCGDVFHGVYAATLAWGWPLEERIRYASASAAIKAGERGAQKGIPSREAVEAFLRERVVA